MNTLTTIPEKEYRALPRLSYSGVKEMRKGPAYYQHYICTPSEDTEDRRMYKAMHMLLGEPERAESMIKVIDGVRRGAVKEQVAAEEAQGFLVLKSDTYDNARKVADFCREHSLVKNVLANGIGEQSLLWTDEETGVECKARTDWLVDGEIIFDFKGFDNLSVYDIEKQIRRMKYHWQAGFYTEGLTAITGQDRWQFVNLFIRTEKPYDIRAVTLPREKILEARSLYRPYIAQYAECTKSGIWPLNPPEITVISPEFYE
jgi:hypothetical protein